jgi:hypothetical protein
MLKHVLLLASKVTSSHYNAVKVAVCTIAKTVLWVLPISRCLLIRTVATVRAFKRYLYGKIKVELSLYLIRWRWVVSFTPWPPYSRGKSPHYPLNRRLGGTQSRSWHCEEEKNVLSLPGIESRQSSPQPVAIPTKLSRLIPLLRSGSHGGDYVEYGLLGCIAIYFRDSLTIRRYAYPPSSGSKSKPSSACCLLLLVSCLAYSYTLNMESVCFSETSDSLRTTRSEDHTLQYIFKAIYMAIIHVWAVRNQCIFETV